MLFARVNALNIHYKLTGDVDEKPVLVLINSLGTDFRIWDGVLPALSEAFSILTYDKRGHGLSDLGDPPYSIEDHAADLAALIDHLGIKKAIICGLSVGGLIAHALWASRPELISGIILSNTANKIGTEETWNERMALVRDKGIVALVDGTMEKWFTKAFRTPENPLYAGFRNMLVRQPVAGYLGTCASVRDGDYREVSPTITVPSMCIAASDDGSTPADLVKATAMVIPGAEFALVENAGHIPCAEQPAVYAHILIDFVRRKELAVG